MRSLNTFTPAQIPQHLIQDAQRATPDSEYPIFVEFLQKYYEFLGGFTVDVERMRDVADAPEQLLQFFSAELSPGLDSRKVLINERKFLPLVRNAYQRKGTVNALELLFRLFYDEAVTVYEPQQQVLKASDGKWFQEKSITVRRTYAAPETPVLQGSVVLNLRSAAGEFNVPAERFVYLDHETVRFYFRVSSRMFISGDEQVTIYNGARVAFRGSLIKSPARILVGIPGKYWRVGQAFSMPGTKDNTVARVLRTDAQGGVQEVEIVHHGYDHPVGQIARLSPFRNAPLTEDVEWEREVTGYDPISGTFQYAHGAQVSSAINGISETIRGVRYPAADPYWEPGYAESDYIGDLVISRDDTSGVAGGTGAIVNPALSYTKWLESLASFYYDYDYVVTYRGKYLTDAGHLSNANIRLQDSYFYQLYSYVVQSSKDISTFRHVVDAVHPAGTKYFSELSKTASVQISKSISGSVGDLKVWLDEGTDGTEESHEVRFDKVLEENVIAAGRLALYADDYFAELYALDSEHDDLSIDVVKVLESDINTGNTDPDRLVPYADDYFAEIYAPLLDQERLSVDVVKALETDIDIGTITAAEPTRIYLPAAAAYAAEDYFDEEYAKLFILELYAEDDYFAEDYVIIPLVQELDVNTHS